MEAQRGEMTWSSSHTRSTAVPEIKSVSWVLVQYPIHWTMLPLLSGLPHILAIFLNVDLTQQATLKIMDSLSDSSTTLKSSSTLYVEQAVQQSYPLVMTPSAKCFAECHCCWSLYWLAKVHINKWYTLPAKKLVHGLIVGCEDCMADLSCISILGEKHGHHYYS